MSLRNWIPRVATRQTSKRRRDRKSKPRRFRPLLEILEDRCVPSFLVTNLLDNGSAGCLRTQIEAAEKMGPGNTVTFQQGLNGTIHLDPKLGVLLLNTSINIDATGANIAISGDFASNVFNILGTASQGVTANLTDLTIEHGINGGTGGLFTDAGGGMVIYFAKVTLNQCNVTDNEATSDGFPDAAGGGIWMDASQLQANHCNITDNIVVGGTGDAQGGGIYALDSSVQLTGGSLLRNKVGGGFGGGVGTNGGSVSAGGNAEGGALYAESGQVFLQGEEIDNNAAFGGAGSRGFESNGLAGGNAEGGALFLSNCGQAQIIACPSHQNKAEGGSGGGGADDINGSQGGDGGPGGNAQGGWLYTNGTSIGMDSKGFVLPYIIQGNEAVGGIGGAGGTGVSQDGKGGVGGNAQGGAIYANPGDQIIFPQKMVVPLNFHQPWGLIDNTAQGGPGGRGGSEASAGAGGNGGNGGDAEGGGVDLSGANCTLTGFVGLNTAQGGQGGQGGNGGKSNNVAGNGGNGGNALGGVLFGDNAEATISTGPFDILRNSATGGQGGNGGAGFDGGNGGNGGSASGGAFDASGASILNIGKDFLQRNVANGGAGGDGGGIKSDIGQGGMGGAGGSAQGGAVNLDHSTANLVQSTLTGNLSKGGQGGFGGLAWNGSAGSGGNGGVGGTGLGGGLAAEDSPNVNLMNDVLDSNFAIGGLGGFAGNGVGLSNVYDGGNGGHGGIGGAGQGGGIGVTGDSNVNITNTTLSSNNALGGDGGWGGFTFEVYFIPPGYAGYGANGGNGDGGGLFVSAVSEAQNGIPINVLLLNDTLSGNIAFGGRGGFGGNNPDSNAGNGGWGGEGRGGGLAAEGGAILLVNDTFNKDFADGGSGGVGGNADDFDIGGTGGDGASGLGGAIYANAGTLPLINVTIDGNNAASGIGGAGGNPTYTIGAQLPSSGGGIYVELFSNADVELTNTIVAQDHADSDPDIAGIFVSGDHDLIGDGTGAFIVKSNIDQIGTSNNPIDPKLTSLGNYGGPTLTMIPKSGSPVIDTGDDAALIGIATAESVPLSLATDQRGFQRLFGLHIDVGATEYGVGPTTPLPGNPTNGAPGVPLGNGIVPPGIHPGHLHRLSEAFEDFGFGLFFTDDFLEDMLLTLSQLSAQLRIGKE
jgi:hypothetical protein